MNVIWTDDAIRTFDRVDIAVAVAAPAGLMTPVLRNVDSRSVSALSAELRELAACVRGGAIAQRDIEGGSLTVSNLGMYGVEEFSAIINPPRSAILAVGATRRQPVAEHDSVIVASTMNVTLSVDHRPVDGATAAERMQAFVAAVETPLDILL